MNDKFLDLSSSADNYGYDSIYDIPESVANYTDNRNVTHPLWAKPFFDREYKTFDEVWNAPANATADTKPTNQELYNQFMVSAKCLQDCYENKYKSLTSPTDDQLTAYYDCKLSCYKAELKTLKPEW